ncbi:MAG: hypothetical protein ABSB95_08330 [Dissulfurispiraceae bacterium]|jgi:hypothetical protein
MNVEIGFNMFRLRQITGIPLTKLPEIAALITYEIIKDNDDFKRKLIKAHSIRDPERQIELDIKKGYEKVV